MRIIFFLFLFIFHSSSLFLNVGKDANDSNLFSPNINYAFDNYENVSSMILFLHENDWIQKNLEIHEKIIEMYIFF